MAIDTTSTSNAPYHDDWSTSGNNAKNYLRILFQPGRSVQARELNQIQSGIQSQIDKFGQHVFKEGTSILDGDINIDNKVQYIDLTLSSGGVAAATDVNRPLVGTEIYTGSTTPASNPGGVDVKAVIIDYENITNDDYRFYLRYTSATTTFDNGSRQHQDIKVGTAVGSHLSADAALGTGTTVVDASYAIKIQNTAGVFFVKGYFVEAPSQTKYITFDNKQTSPVENTNGKVGFIVTESNLTAVNDNTLYDNATGSPNFQAPGADRYTISLGLCFITDDTAVNDAPAHVVATNTSNVIDIVQITESEVYAPVTVKYDKLGANLAQRTFEESGDYALAPFTLDLREHLKVGGNRGKFTSAQGGVDTNFVASLEPSVAYVKGERVEVQSKQDIVVSKGRDVNQVDTSVQFQAKFGNYIIADTLSYLPKTDGTTSYTIHTDTGATSSDIGTCNIRGIEYTGQFYKVYLSNISGLGSNRISAAKALKGDADNQDANQDAIIAINTSKRKGFQLFDTHISNEIFSLPTRFVKTLNDPGTDPGTHTISIPIRKSLPDVNVTSSTTVDISASAGEVFYQDNPNEYLIVDEATGVTLPCTDVNITGTQSATLTFTVPSANGGNPSAVDVIASVRRAGVRGTKSRAQGTTTFTNTFNLTTVGNSMPLTTTVAEYDAINIYEVTVDGTDYTDNFSLDNGQTETAYGQPRIILNKVISGVTGSTHTVIANFTYFNSTAQDFYSVDSYTGLGDTQGLSSNDVNGAVARQEIAYPTGVSLLDTLDFRGGAALDPNGLIQIGTMTSYLPRQDKVCIRSTGELEYVLGDALTDTAAELPEDAMLLYELDVPPFCSSVADIEIGYTDNRRYTMRDIGKIEKRVKNLEYYTSLSLLEQSTKDKQIFDDAGERFKNGILVDEFKGFGVANTADPAYAAAMEPETGILRPTFKGNTFSMRLANTTAADTDPTGSAAIGGHDHVRLKSTGLTEFIKQSFASVAISVNPFDVASWVGELEISPKSDEWRDTTRRPDVIIRQDTINAATLNLVNEQLASQGTRWNDWETTWTGQPRTTDLGWVNNAGAERLFGDEHSTRRGRRWRRSTFSVPSQNGGTLTARQRNGQVRVANITVDSNQVRSGVSQFATRTTVTQNLGDRVVDVSFVPFIRSRRLYFRATGLKPNTTVKPYFDGVDVSGYTVPTAYVEFRDDANRVDHTNDSPGDISSGALVTNDSGTITGYIVIPNNDDLRFRTGEREVIITDADATNGEVNLANAKTYAKAEYSARGLIQTVQNQVLSTQRLQISNRRETQTRTVNTVTDTVATAVRHVDPLAQTFLIDGDLYPTGVFLKDIDLYFKDLDPNLPVRIYLAPTQTGIPTQQIIPFTEVKKYPSRAKAVAAGVVASGASDAEKDKHVAFGSTDASVPTNFVFKSPVYLKPGTEYAVVVLSNSPEYTLWHSEVGGTDVTAGAGGQRITKNPYTGVALKSANASTWTPDQTKDFKFTLRKMNFATTTGTSGSSLSSNGYSSTFTTVYPASVGTTKISAINLLATTIILPKTGVTFNLALRGSDNITKNYTLVPGRVYELDSEVEISDAADLVLTCLLKTDDSHITPMVDINRLTLQTFSNVINKPTGNDEVSRGSTGEAVDGHGTATARYITKTTKLNNASSQIDMFLDVNRPHPDTDVFAFARFGGPGVSSNAFVLLDNPAIPVSGGFKEIQFTSDISKTGSSFDEFEIKIVMVSPDIAKIPTCKNLRVIATA